MWATLYFAQHEDKLCDNFSNRLLFYSRYIDDGIGIWDWTGTPACTTDWENYKQAMNDYGSLEWEFSNLLTTVNYLDLTLSLRNGQVESTLYEKKLNLYLYLPPHSAHAPGILKGLISGMVLRILRLTSNATTRKLHIRRFFQRLVARGFQPPTLKPIFDNCLRKYNKPATIAPQKRNFGHPIILHLPYHPLDPPSSAIQRLFAKHMICSKSNNPYGNVPLKDIRNHHGAPIMIDRLIVAYHRPPNLGNQLCP
jgi:hypothetical protein